jgi:cell division protein FtsB
MDKKQSKNLFAHPLTVGVFACLCLLAIFSLRESSKKALISKSSIEKLEKNVQNLETEVSLETEKIKNSQKEIALEKIRRNELLLKKEGEIILQIPDEEQNLKLKTDPENKKNGPLEEWKKLFKN